MSGRSSEWLRGLIMMHRYAALAVGCVYSLLGMLGLIPPLHENWPAGEPMMAVRNGRGFLFGIFPNNLVLTMIHIGIGIWGLSAFRTYQSSRWFVRSTLSIFGVLAILGLLPMVDSLAGLIPTFGYTAWLHTATALALVGMIVISRRATDSGEPADRSATARTMSTSGVSLHAFLATFPVAFLTGAVGTDVAHWWTTMDWYVDYEGFWGTASLWLVGVGLVSGVFASLAGLIDSSKNRETIRWNRISPHAMGSIGGLALTFVNLLIRFDDQQAMIIPWGLLLSLAAAGLIVYCGWYAGFLLRPREIHDH